MNFDPEALVRPSFLAKTTSHLLRTHRWQRIVFGIAVLLFSTGAVGSMSNYLSNPTTTSTSPATPGSYNNDVPAPAAQPEQTTLQKLSLWGARVGGSLLGGFLIGFALRTFVRITSALLALGLSVFMLLSYFHVMNADLTTAETKYKNSIEWLNDQAYRLRNVAQSHLPSSGATVVGAFAGFRRKKAVV